ncbi:hypothetical protein IFR05_017271, partial [Cadophora sp. M221]
VATVGPSGIVTGHQALNDAEVSSSEIIRNVKFGFFDNPYFTDLLIEIKEALGTFGDPSLPVSMASILKKLLVDIWAGTDAYLTARSYNPPKIVCFTTPIGTSPNAQRALCHAAAEAGFSNPTTSDCDDIASRLCYMIHDSWTQGDGASKEIFGKFVALFDCGYGISQLSASKIDCDSDKRDQWRRGEVEKIFSDATRPLFEWMTENKDEWYNFYVVMTGGWTDCPRFKEEVQARFSDVVIHFSVTPVTAVSLGALLIATQTFTTTMRFVHDNFGMGSYADRLDLSAGVDRRKDLVIIRPLFELSEKDHPKRESDAVDQWSRQVLTRNGHITTHIYKIKKEVQVVNVPGPDGDYDAIIASEDCPYLGVLQLKIDPNIAKQLKLGKKPKEFHVLRRFYCEGNNLDVKYAVYITPTPKWTKDRSSLISLGTGEIREILMWDSKAVSVRRERLNWEAWINRNVEEASKIAEQTSSTHVSKKRKILKAAAGGAGGKEFSPSRQFSSQLADANSSGSSAETNMSPQSSSVQVGDNAIHSKETNKAAEINFEEAVGPKKKEKGDVVVEVCQEKRPNSVDFPTAKVEQMNMVGKELHSPSPEKGGAQHNQGRDAAKMYQSPSCESIPDEEEGM